jgi:hypothetical protein
LRGKLVHYPLNPLRSSPDPLVTKSALMGSVIIPVMGDVGSPLLRISRSEPCWTKRKPSRGDVKLSLTFATVGGVVTCGIHGGAVSHPVLEGKPNANHVRARISYSRTQQLHNMDIITQCSNSIKRELIVDYIVRLRRPYSSYNKSKCGKET